MMDETEIKYLIATFVIIVVIILLLIITTSEIDKNRTRSLECSSNMYYTHGNWITAPFNYLVMASVRDKDDLNPYPSIESNFSNHHILKNNWKEIAQEVTTLYNAGEMKRIDGDMFFKRIADSKWKRFYIKWYGPSLKEAKDKLPLTTKLIDSLPEIRSAMISVLEPGSIITPHIGPYRGVLRYHLGLSTPKDSENCWITVDGEKHVWKNGEDFLFDDTYVHEVQNKTKDVRIILFCDIQRNLNGNFSNSMIELSSMIAKVTTRNNK